MSGKHKTPLVGWHPPAGLLARFTALVERRKVAKSVILNKALSDYLDRHESAEDN